MYSTVWMTGDSYVFLVVFDVKTSVFGASLLNERQQKLPIPVNARRAGILFFNARKAIFMLVVRCEEERISLIEM